MTSLDDDTTGGNGFGPLNDRAFRWAVGILLSAVLAVSALIYGSIDRRVASLESVGSPPLRERLARTEADLAQIDRSIREIKADQKEILSLLREHTENDR